MLIERASEIELLTSQKVTRENVLELSSLEWRKEKHSAGQLVTM